VKHLEPLWLAEEAAAAIGGQLIGSDSWIASGVSIDTRSLQPGDLFVALKDARDGHDFLDAAFAAGACAALVSDVRDAPGPLLRAPDVLDSLRALGIAARNRSPAKRVGITGSVGKTSSKEALAACLAAAAPTHASVKSYNNHWGVPLTLARMPRSSAYGVFEMGMNHRHEIAPLSQQVRPDVAIVTWIAPAHIENLGSLEAIADEKGDIYSGLATGGIALAPAEAPHAGRLLNAARAHAAQTLTFGLEPGRDARLLSFTPDPAGGSIAVAEILGARVHYRVGADGAHWGTNSIAALLATAVLGGAVDAAAHALEGFTAPEGRGQVSAIQAAFGAFTLIDDSYNANPTSMAAAFSTLAARAPGPSGRRIAILGDMLELGPQERAFHQGLAEPLLQAGVDLVFCAGPRMAALYDALPGAHRGGYAETAQALAPIAAAALLPGDVVLAKGSNGSRIHQLVASLKELAVD
jgi:UDP-N-acetylmuramoyl-tripeptide--D-alanyl-D-alanine ligase